MDLTERVIGLLILLYAQHLPRIVRLTVEDITSRPDDSNIAGDRVTMSRGCLSNWPCRPIGEAWEWA